MKKDIIIQTSQEIVEHIYSIYGIEIDVLDIAEFINLNMGFLFMNGDFDGK